jgi:hypothetical protein
MKHAGDMDVEAFAEPEQFRCEERSPLTLDSVPPLDRDRPCAVFHCAPVAGRDVVSNVPDLFGEWAFKRFGADTARNQRK